MYETTVEIPVVFMILIGIVTLTLLIALMPPAMLKSRKFPWEGLQDKLGMSSIPSLPFALLLALWCILFIALFLGLLWVIGAVASIGYPGGSEEWRIWAFSLAKLASLTAVLAAMVALPMSLVRLGFTRAQNQTAEEALYNDKMNAAVADLHAQRQVTEWYTDKHGQKHAANGWEDDITRRNGAIDTLRGLATERPELLERIDQMLSVYLRELTREFPPVLVPEDASLEELQEWAADLKPVRSDMNNAVVALSKLPRTKEQMMSNDLPDLAEVNMQGFRLSGVSLPKANLLRAELQGANLIGAELQGANFFLAKLQKADLIGVKLQGVNFFGAQLQGANLTGARLRGANFSSAEMEGAILYRAQLQRAVLPRALLQGADLSWANLHGADLSQAELQGADFARAEFDPDTNLSSANLRGAAVRTVNFSNVPQIIDHLDGLFGDATVELPEGVKRPNRFNKKYESWVDFRAAWRAFQRSIGQDPDNPE